MPDCSRSFCYRHAARLLQRPSRVNPKHDSHAATSNYVSHWCISSNSTSGFGPERQSLPEAGYLETTQRKIAPVVMSDHSANPQKCAAFSQ
jgi:hypothetical protein